MVGPGLPDYHCRVDGQRPTAEEVIPVDLEMARRYADVSGDFSEHHFDVQAARRSGYESPFLHGLCTMALCARVVVQNLCGGEPSRLRRLAVRFASPAFLGRDLTVRIPVPREEDSGVFEAISGGDAAIGNGFASYGHLSNSERLRRNGARRLPSPRRGNLPDHDLAEIAGGEPGRHEAQSTQEEEREGPVDAVG